MKKLSVVAALIYNDKGELFTAQRSETMSFPLLWEFPGGKVEVAETKPVALARELAEELGIHAEVEPDCLATTTYIQADLQIDLYFYAVHHFQGVIRLHEHAQSRWVHPSELEAAIFAPADREIVRRLQAGWQQ